jgi:hypothetical protein
MLDEQPKYNYKGQTFASEEAMNLFIASRNERSKDHTDFGTPAKKKRIPWQYVLFGLIVLLAVSKIFESKSQANSAKIRTSQPSGSGVSEDSKSTLAALINLNGELCARVTEVSLISSDVYRVACIRYRDGTGSATYEVNLSTGAVK